MTGEALLCRHCFPHEMIAYAILFLTQNRLRSRGIINHRHVATINVTWALNRYSHHPKFVPNNSKRFHSVLHGNVFGFKQGWFHTRMFLWKPLNKIHIQKDHKTSAIVPGGIVSCMINVDHHPQVYTLSKGHRSVWRDCLLKVTIKTRPVFISIEFFINTIRIGRFKIQARVMFPFQLRHNMKSR